MSVRAVVDDPDILECYDRVDWYRFTDVSTERSAFVARIRQSTKTLFLTVDMKTLRMRDHCLPPRLK